MSTLDGETVIVTGASRGLGASMAKRLAREGANVVLTARTESGLVETAAEAGGETLVTPADVTDERAVRAVVDAAVDEYGTVTGLVNNAGIGLLSMYDHRRDLTAVEAADFRRVLDVNVTGVYLCSKHAIPWMVDAGGGNVVNVSSGLGTHAVAGFGPYVASKWALEGLTRTQALELEDDGVNVNALSPGGRVATRFWDHLPADERDGILDPDVMNDAVTLLLAQPPSGVTGESLSAAEWERRLRETSSTS